MVHLYSLLRLLSCTLVVFPANPSPTAVSIGRVPFFLRCSTDGQGSSITDSTAFFWLVSLLEDRVPNWIVMVLLPSLLQALAVFIDASQAKQFRCHQFPKSGDSNRGIPS